MCDEACLKHALVLSGFMRARSAGTAVRRAETPEQAGRQCNLPPPHTHTHTLVLHAARTESFWRRAQRCAGTSPGTTARPACVCVRACVRACVRVCVCVRVCARVRMRVSAARSAVSLARTAVPSPVRARLGGRPHVCFACVCVCTRARAWTPGNPILPMLDESSKPKMPRAWLNVTRLRVRACVCVACV